MSEENEISLPPHLQSYEDEQNYICCDEKVNDHNKKNNKQEYDKFSSDIDSSEKINKVDNIIEVKDENNLEKAEKIAKNYFPNEYTEKTDLLQQIDDLDNQDVLEKLNSTSEHELLEKIKELQSANFYLSKENEVYEFILNDDEMLHSFLGKVQEEDKDIIAPESFELIYLDKCYFAKKKLEHAEKTLKQKNDDHAHALQNLNFELQSLNKSLNNLNEAKEKFDKDIRIDGQHPVTKKVVLQKVAKYFDDNIRFQMDLANRYRMQIEDDIREQNKLINQIKAQEKRLAFLDMTEFQKAQFEYKKSCRELAMCKEQLGKWKAKQSFFIQKISKLKKISELKAEMRKIKLDPRRRNLPEVIDYAAVQRENRIQMKNVDKWRKKVEALQQEKLLHLKGLIKK